MKLFSPCETCKIRRIIIKKRKIKLPIGEIATSKKLLCGKCFKAITNKLNEQSKTA